LAAAITARSLANRDRLPERHPSAVGLTTARFFALGFSGEAETDDSLGWACEA